MAVKSPALVLHENKVLAVVIGCAASCIELFTTIDMCQDQQTCGHERVKLAMAVGAVGAALCAIRLPMFRLWPSASLFDVHFAFLLCLMWSLGVAFNTSTGGPFAKTNNGFYSSWIALAAAVTFAYLSVEGPVRVSLDAEVARQRGSLVVVFFASLVEMAVAADVCDNGGCSWQEASGVIIGLLSVLTVGGHIIFVRNSNPMHEVSGKALAPWCLALWSLAAGLNTSVGGPFTSSCDAAVPAANGFFSTWVAFFASLYYAWAELLVVLPEDALTKTFGGDECDGVGIGPGAHEQPYRPLASADGDEL